MTINENIKTRGWSSDQVTAFARRFAGTHRTAWHAYVPDVREALIASFVLLIVLGQDAKTIDVEEVRSLQLRLAVRLAERHQMSNPTAELAE